METGFPAPGSGSQVPPEKENISSNLRAHPPAKGALPVDERTAKLWKKIDENLKAAMPEKERQAALREAITTLDRLVSKAQITKEARYFDCSEEVAKLKMLNRLLIYKRAGVDVDKVSPAIANREEVTGYSFSLIKTIEKAFRAHLFEGIDAKMVDLGEKRLQAILFKANDTLRLFIQESKAGSGTSKLVHFASDYFSQVSPEEERRFVTLQLIEEEVEVSDSASATASTSSESESEASGTAVFSRDAVPVDLSHIEVPEEIEYAATAEFEKEINIARMLQAELTEMLHIYHVVHLESGQKIVVQEAAGFKMKGKMILNLQNLSEHVESHPELKPELYRLLAESFDMILELHKRGWIHRDIKDENILINARGHAAVSDFGSACRIEDNEKKAGGTPAYMAPECGLHNNPEIFKQISEKADVWSAAMTLQQTLLKTTHRLMQAIEKVEQDPLLKKAEHLATQLGQFAIDPQKQAEYEAMYPEPSDKNSLEHLIWISTRIDPKQRPPMEEYCKRFHAICDRTAA